MKKINGVAVTFLAAVFGGVPALAQRQEGPKDRSSDAMKDCPMHKSGHDHASANGTTLESRGNAGMGFEQSKTTHHFLIKADGGVIQVQANDAQDATSIARIRTHFHHISAAFAAGDFQVPMLVHDELVPGTTTMKRLREKIQYMYEETGSGARVVIKTADPSALEAIHDFLRYQIREHQTGDPEMIP